MAKHRTVLLDTDVSLNVTNRGTDGHTSCKRRYVAYIPILLYCLGILTFKIKSEMVRLLK